MATEAEAAREARAKVRHREIEKNKNLPKIFPFLQVIAAEGEQKASNALKQAAEVIQQSPHALQVRRDNETGKIFDKNISAAISPDPELDICRAQLHHHIPDAHDLTELGLNVIKSLPSSIK